MIALPNTYGRELKLSKDTIVTYTLEENRKIAILLKQGEYDAKRTKNLENIIYVQDSIINKNKVALYEITNNVESLNNSISKLEAANKDMLRDLKKYIKRSSNWSKVAIGSLGLNVVFILTLIII